MPFSLSLFKPTATIQHSRFLQPAFGNVPKSPPQWHDVKRLLTLADQTLQGQKRWQSTSVPSQLNRQMVQAFQTTLSDGTQFTYSLPQAINNDPQESVAVTYERLFNTPSSDHLQIPSEFKTTNSAQCAELFEEATALLNQVLLLPQVCQQLEYPPDKVQALKQKLLSNIQGIRGKLPNKD